MAIERGRIKFEVPTKAMKIDWHPFPTNMDEPSGKKNALQTKMLTSQLAKESGAVDPKVQAPANQVKGKSWQDQAENSQKHKKCADLVEEMKIIQVP